MGDEMKGKLDERELERILLEEGDSWKVEDAITAFLRQIDEEDGE
jgi:hypothetical protein